MRNIFVVCVVAVLAASCTWVKLSPEGDKVRVLSAAEVSRCKKLGKTTVSLKATIAGFERKAEKVKKELAILARNRAVDLNGDTVVPLTEVENGQQTFSIYRCVNP